MTSPDPSLPQRRHEILVSQVRLLLRELLILMIESVVVLSEDALSG